MDIHTVGKRVSEHSVWVSTPTKSLWTFAGLGKLSTTSLPVKNQAPLLTLLYLSQSSLRNIFLASEHLLPDQTYKIIFWYFNLKYLNDLNLNIYYLIFKRFKWRNCRCHSLEIWTLDPERYRTKQVLTCISTYIHRQHLKNPSVPSTLTILQTQPYT